MAISFVLSLIFVGGLLLVGALLLLTSFRARNPRAVLPGDLPVDPSVYGPAQTNKWLRFLRFGFIGACAVVLCFHGYWAFGVDANQGYSTAAARDLRNRRISEAGLKGWVFDRTGKTDRALIRYAVSGQDIVRNYPLGEAAVNVTGYSDFIYGSAGIERAYGDYLTEPTSLQNALSTTVPVGKDITTTVDSDMQRRAFELLKATGKRGAIVVLSLPTNEVLASATFPSFDPGIVNDEAGWKALNIQRSEFPQISPMTDRAVKTYYAPGSTFKVLVATAALEAGMGDAQFTCSGGGFTPPGTNRPIYDDSGGGGHGHIGMAEALRVSCNQYFAQLGLALGPQRLGEVAQRFGLITEREGPLRATNLFRYRLADPRDFNVSMAPPPARVFLPADFGKDYTRYDLAIESFGQGANDMTIMQLALIASGVADTNGQLVKPTFELDAPLQPLGTVCSPQTAARVREMMKLVVDGGTAANAFASLRGRISAAGKTGTAQRIVQVFDPKTGKPKVVKNSKGEEETVREQSTDALFMGFAPYEHPRIAFAMIVENGGHGGTAAAPLAVGMIQKAAELGYIEAPPAPAAPTKPAKSGKPAKKRR